MAAQGVTVNSTEAALVANTAKTMLQIKAATNVRVVLKDLILTDKSAAGGTGATSKVRLTRSTANFGTAGSSPAGTKTNPSNGETINTAFGANFSVEPTSPTDTGLWFELPSGGSINLIDLPENYCQIPGGQSLNIELTNTGTPTVMVSARIEE